jgi:hypothetical protein
MIEVRNLREVGDRMGQPRDNSNSVIGDCGQPSLHAAAETHNSSKKSHTHWPSLFAAGRGGAQMRCGRNGAARIRSDESGQALVLSAMCLSLLMGGMALAVDVSNVHYRQRQLETAADSAAIAAGLEISNCSNAVCANMKTAAEKA